MPSLSASRVRSWLRRWPTTPFTRVITPVAAVRTPKPSTCVKRSCATSSSSAASSARVKIAHLISANVISTASSKIPKPQCAL
eukprot:15528-Heterococcus_DN1.PRE.10